MELAVGYLAFRVLESETCPNLFKSTPFDTSNRVFVDSALPRDMGACEPSAARRVGTEPAQPGEELIVEERACACLAADLAFFIHCRRRFGHRADVPDGEAPAVDFFPDFIRGV